MLPELPPVLRGDPRGGTGGGTLSLITTVFWRSGGKGAPVDGICGAGCCFFDLPCWPFPLVRVSIGLPGLFPVAVDGSDLFVFALPPAKALGPVAVAGVAVAWVRFPRLFLDDEEVTPINSNRFSALE